MLTFKRIVSVSVGDEYVEGPSAAVIDLNEKDIRRIYQLAEAVKKLDVAYIEDWYCPDSWNLTEHDISNSNRKYDKKTGDYLRVITNKTTPKQAALLINDEDIMVSTLAKEICAGRDIDSPEVFEVLKNTLVTEFDGSIDCELLKVSPDDFHFTGYIKHTNVSISTDCIPLSDLPPLPTPRKKAQVVEG